eukprot:Skav202598  [mRNA]  locus=scaffold2348:79591:81762:- [translate_table: standard]
MLCSLCMQLLLFSIIGLPNWLPAHRAVYMVLAPGQQAVLMEVVLARRLHHLTSRLCQSLHANRAVHDLAILIINQLFRALLHDAQLFDCFGAPGLLIQLVQH